MRAIVRTLLASLAVALGSSAANAEALQIRGVYPPAANIPASVEVIVIERLEGDLGADIEVALFDRLSRVTVRGEPWFDVMRPEELANAEVRVETEGGNVGFEPLQADASLRGTLRSEVIERRIEPKIKTECVRRDDDDKCVEEEEIRIGCRELTVRVEPRLLLLGSNGAQLYSRNSGMARADRYCADERDVPSSLAMANAMIDDLADAIRRDLAPRPSSRSVRVMERRRDLNRADRGAFRDAVRLIDDDPIAGCSGFEALEATNQDHLSVLFNIGLCREYAGRLEDAASYYRRARAVDADHDYPRRGLGRIADRQRAEALIAKRKSS